MEGIDDLGGVIKGQGHTNKKIFFEKQHECFEQLVLNERLASAGIL